jgi:pSer/pThr/pTyr-binding forkhead associated (FHA) protein
MAQLLQVDSIVGPGQVKRETFQDDVVVFGRDIAAQIVITEKTASRRHGELKVVNGKWTLFNLSPNGTLVNGKEITTKPVVIKEKDRVSIGGTVVFEVVRASVQGDEEPTEQTDTRGDRRPQAQDPEQAARDAALKKQRRLLTFGAIYAVGLLGLILFFLTLGDGPSSKQLTYPPRLTEDQIAKAVQTPFRLSGSPDLRVAQDRLDHASQLYERLQNLKEQALYETYVNYKISLANFNTKQFEKANDNLRFDTVQQRLIFAINTYYNRAYEQMRAGQFIEADESAKMITVRLFPEPGSDVHKNVTQMRQLCIEQIKNRRKARTQ